MNNKTLRSILLIYVNEKKRKHIAKKEIQEIFLKKKGKRKEREILLW